jgi:NTP pyrophosphatase (non-canonical NTP hydrolase)
VSERHAMIGWFAGRMQAKIEARGYHGKLPQEQFTFGWFLLRLQMEGGELAEALLTVLEALPPTPQLYQNIIDECADVANFAMQIADKAARMHDELAARDPEAVRP